MIDQIDPKVILVIFVKRTPHPGIVAIRDEKDYIRALLYSYPVMPLLQGGGALLTSTFRMSSILFGDTMVPNIE